ncbi:MAG: Asp-tRNA(Asn)/Glu-tRNA(Gln) amidotransferase GatCAB subunit B, partial [Betaproteobacteria bacterium]
QMMTQSLATARYYEAARQACGQAKLAANWVMGEISKRLNAAGIEIEASPVGPVLLGALIRRVQDGTVPNNSARQVFEDLWSEGTSRTNPEADVAQALAAVDALIEAKGLKQMNDSGALEAIVDEVIAANEKSVAEYRSGKDKAFNALVGQVMKASKGKANPAQAGELLKQKLG